MFGGDKNTKDNNQTGLLGARATTYGGAPQGGSSGGLQEKQNGSGGSWNFWGNAKEAAGKAKEKLTGNNNKYNSPN